MKICFPVSNENIRINLHKDILGVKQLDLKNLPKLKKKILYFYKIVSTDLFFYKNPTNVK